jgi:hypothetical protein
VDVDATIAKIEELVDAHPEAAELVRLLAELYGTGLRRVVELSGGDTVNRLAGDPLLGSLLLLHGLHPVDAATRLRTALQRMERRLESQRVRLAEINDGVAVIRIEQLGAGMPPASLAQMIEDAAMEAAPDLDGIEIEGAITPAATGLVQIAPARLQSPAVRSGERCEFCSVSLESEHAHVVDVEERRLVCSCRACRLLFVTAGAARGRYRAVGDRVERVPESELDWDALDAPVGMAFFIRHSKTGGVTAFYPSPGGATESALSMDRAESALQGIEPDIEALLVYRRGSTSESWIVPVDACYELVGRIRRSWRGFDGGTEVRTEIESFFAHLEEQRSATCQT